MASGPPLRQMSYVGDRGRELNPWKHVHMQVFLPKLPLLLALSPLCKEGRWAGLAESCMGRQASYEELSPDAGHASCRWAHTTIHRQDRRGSRDRQSTRMLIAVGLKSLR